jgi:hypothetical protein
MTLDRRAEPAGLDRVEMQRKTSARGQSMAGRIGLVLEIKQPLWRRRAPRWRWLLSRNARLSP